MSGKAVLQTQAWIGALALAALLAGYISSTTGAMAQGNAPDYPVIIAAPDRTDADRQTDKRRDPTPLLVLPAAGTARNSWPARLPRPV
jgi:hypothetical protein